MPENWKGIFCFQWACWSVGLVTSKMRKLGYRIMGFPDSSASQGSTCNAGDPGSVPGSGRSAGEGIGYPLQYWWASLVAQVVKNLPAMWEIWEDPWVGKIPWRRAWQPTPVLWPGESSWTEEPGGLQSMGLQIVRRDWVTQHTHNIIGDTGTPGTTLD